MAISSLVDTSVSDGILVTQPVSTNTKGAWTQLTASSAIAADGVIVTPLVATQNGDFLLDIGTGASSSEVAIISNLPSCRQNTSSTSQGVVTFPIAIASSTRISARYQCTTASPNMRVSMYLIAKDSVLFNECTSSVTYGANTADSGGTGIDPGGTAHTKGSYTQLTASSSADHQWFVVCAGFQNNTTAGDTSWLVDIATGGAGAESVIIPNLYFRTTSYDDIVIPAFYPAIPLVVASGTRLSARAQCSTNASPDRLLDIILIGFSGTHSAGGGGASFGAHIR